MPALRLAVEMLREPAFPDAEFDQVKKQRVAGIENNRTDPAALAPLALNRAMNPFPRGDVRYVGTIDEQIEDVNKVTLDDVRKFHARFYGASHGEIVVVGQFKEAEVRAAAAELLGAWSAPAPYERIATTYQKTTPVNLKIETPDKQNATFEAALDFAMSDTDPDYPAMVLANYMFGGSITGRAPNRIRNQEGLSYGVNSRFGGADRRERGHVRRHGDQQSRRTRRRWKRASATSWRRRWRAASRRTRWPRRRRRCTISGSVGRTQDAALLNLIATREEFGRTLAWDEQMDAKLEALTVDQVNAAFRRHVSLDQLSIVKAGDFKAAGVFQQ